MTDQPKRTRPVRKILSFSVGEWETVQRRMQIASARSFEDFARRAILDQEIVVQRIAFDPQVVGAELARIGNNINQIARNVNTEAVTTLDEMRATRALVREIQAVIERAANEV